MEDVMDLVALALGSGFLGSAVGHFLALPVLITITAASFVIAVILFMKLKEIGSLVAFMFGVCAVAWNVVMWTTYYIETNQTWLGEFIHQYILR